MMAGTVGDSYLTIAEEVMHAPIGKLPALKRTAT